MEIKVQNILFLQFAFFPKKQNIHSVWERNMLILEK